MAAVSKGSELLESTGASLHQRLRVAVIKTAHMDAVSIPLLPQKSKYLFFILSWTNYLFCLQLDATFIIQISNMFLNFLIPLLLQP